jgi:hypothetical protein
MIKQDPFFTTVQKEEEDPGKLPGLQKTIDRPGQGDTNQQGFHSKDKPPI